MLIYIALFSFLTITSLLSLDSRIRVNQVLLFYILLCITLLLGLRLGVGSDYFSYQRIFNNLEDPSNYGLVIYSLSETTPVETGFALFMYAIKAATSSYEIYVFAFALISIIPKYYIFKKLSPFVAISFLIYFCDEWFWKDLSGARVSFASTLILLSVFFVKERRPLHFVVTILFATWFHTSALIALPLYWIIYFNKLWFLVVVFLASIAISIKGGIGLYLPEIASALGFDGTARIIKYANSEYVGEGGFFRGTNLIHVALCTLMMVCYKKLCARWHFNDVLIPMYIFGTSAMFIFVDYGIIWGRFREMICVPAAVIILPSFILIFKGNQRIVPYAVILAYCLLWFYLMLQGRAPYNSLLHSAI